MSTPGVKTAAWSSGLVLLAAVAQLTATMVDIDVLGAPGGGRLYYLALGLYGLAGFMLNSVVVVLAIVDLWIGRLRAALFVFSILFLLWQVMGVAGAADVGHLRDQWYFTFGDDLVLTFAYRALLIALLGTAAALLVRPGRWKWGMREIGRRAHDYYTVDLPIPATVDYPPMGGPVFEGPPAAMREYRPTHLRGTVQDHHQPG
jgi:hypothetical protein